MALEGSGGPLRLLVCLSVGLLRSQILVGGGFPCQEFKADMLAECMASMDKDQVDAINEVLGV